MAKNTKTVEKENQIIAKRLVGVIVSDKMDKSRVVAIEEKLRHPLYLKSYKKTSKIMAHDPNNAFVCGDKVEIEQIRPQSKKKAWQIMRKLEGQSEVK